MSTSSSGSLPAFVVAVGASNIRSRSALTFFKSSKVANQLDTWVYFHEQVFHAYYLTALRWDGIGLATSPDGVHWHDYGQVIDRSPEATWLGSGAVWRSGDKFIMNFSESLTRWPDAGAAHGSKQTIYFAESADLIRWARVDGKKFAPDSRWYDPEGRWDCIWPIERPGGGYYGYFTATPKEGSAGLGFGQSSDGTTWSASAPAKLADTKLHREAGAVAVREGKYYALVSGSAGAKMDTLVVDAPEGPFTSAKKNRGLLVANSSYFARFVQTPDGLLVNHHSWETGPLNIQRGNIYMAPLKRAVWDDEGTLRLKWWDGNDAAKKVVSTLLLRRPNIPLIRGGP